MYSIDTRPLTGRLLVWLRYLYTMYPFLRDIYYIVCENIERFLFFKFQLYSGTIPAKSPHVPYGVTSPDNPPTQTYSGELLATLKTKDELELLLLNHWLLSRNHWFICIDDWSEKRTHAGYVTIQCYSKVLKAFSSPITIYSAQFHYLEHGGRGRFSEKNLINIS